MKRVKKKVPDLNEGDMYDDPYDPYSASEGCLGVVIGKKKHNTLCIDWMHCREEFQTNYPNASRVLYFTDHIKEVAAFIEDAEKILKLPKKHRAKLYRTNKKDVLYCQLGDWWTSKVRRQLFTILLRAGKEYNLSRRNFWACARKNNYLSRTNAAFRHFMNGNTTFRHGYIGDYFDGWVDCFSYITPQQIKERLVKDNANRKRAQICSSHK